MIENVSLNLDFSSNCHCRTRFGGDDHEATGSGATRAEFLEDQSGLDRLAEADLVAQQESVRIVRNDAMHNGHLMRLDVDA